MGMIQEAILNMPDELFWSDDPILRIQHNNARKGAATTIATLTAERDEANELASDNSRSYHFAAEVGAGWKHLAREYGKRHAQHREALDALKEAVALTESEMMADMPADFVRVFHAAKDCIESTEVKLPLVNDQQSEQ